MIPLLLLSSLLLLLPPQVRPGCFQKRLCCTGRNSTCKDQDDGIEHLPTVDYLRRGPHPSRGEGAAYQMPHYENSGDGYDLVYPSVYEAEKNERIGKLVLPDVVQLEGSGAENIYNKYGPNEGPANLVHPTTPARKITHFLFGMAEGPDREPEDQAKYTEGARPKHLLIRYSVLSQHLPLTVSSSHLHEDEPYSIQYLEAVPIDCYCDEVCVSLGDCCSDYTFVCPPRDCYVDNWSSWSECTPDDGRCGLGEQKRERAVVHPAERGGAPCPPLKEMRTCHKACPAKILDDLTTVALLLDYKWNETRRSRRRNNVYWDHPKMAKRLNLSSFYCVEYELGWVNRNCVDKKITARLHRGNTICAECQPEATLHRNTARCASDLEDGDEGFWKLIGPQSCNGIWRRLRRHDDCRCARNLPERDPFLLV